MRSLIVFLFVSLLLSLAYFAVPPGVELISKVDSENVVRHVRCETRDAAKSMIFEELQLQMSKKDRPISKLATDIYARFGDNDNEDHFDEFNPSVLFLGYPNIINYFNLIYETEISYDFEFKVDEKRSLNSEIGIGGPFFKSITLGIAGRLTGLRSTIQRFTIVDNVGDMLRSLGRLRGGTSYCRYFREQKSQDRAVVGKVGIYGIIRQYLTVVIFDNLRIGKADAADFTDKLTFSTEVELSANGKPVINVQSRSADSHSESNKINVTTNHASMQEMSLGFSIRSKRGKETLENIRRLISK